MRIRSDQDPDRKHCLLVSKILRYSIIVFFFRLVPVLVRSMKYSEIDIILLKGDVEEVSYEDSLVKGRLSVDEGQ